MPKRLLGLKVNGRLHEVAAAQSALLIEVLRDVLGLTGTKRGCDGGECGACTVLVDDQPRLACITLAASVEGRRIETIEGQARGGELSALQRAFHEKLGTQCGYCTPGMVLRTAVLLEQHPKPTQQQIEAALDGSLCRCCGYPKILAAVRRASEASHA